MVKEALFNILADRVYDAAVLDLFAGSGALGIEALSRGAERAIFVEQDRKAVAVVRNNLEQTGLEAQGQVMRADALRAIAGFHRSGQQFELIFADPPYGRQLAVAVVQTLAPTKLLSDDGCIVIEHHHLEELPSRLTNIEQIRAAKYGDTMLTFYGPTSTY